MFLIFTFNCNFKFYSCSALHSMFLYRREGKEGEGRREKRNGFRREGCNIKFTDFSFE